MKKNDKYVCLGCGYIYDPAKGDRKQGVPEGVGFNDLPPEWKCPLCKIRKEAFRVW